MARKKSEKNDDAEAHGGAGNGPAAAEGKMPEQIRLLAPHGFIDEDGKNRHWQQGQVVFEPDDVALLIERGADYEPVEA